MIKQARKEGRSDVPKAPCTAILRKVLRWNEMMEKGLHRANLRNKLIWPALFLFLCIAPGLRASADTAYGYILPESDLRIYTQEELSGMPLQVVCYAKNEIYARDGRMFQSAELQNYFSAQYWYTALYQPDQFTADMLNTYEQQNLELLSGMEAQLGTYALDSGDYSYDVVYDWIQYGTMEDAGEAAAEDAFVTSDPYAVDPDSYIFYDSDRRYLSADEISGLTTQELCYARYEIYARRGQLFDSQELTDYFDQKNWYWGYLSSSLTGSDILNTYEQSNVALLQETEEAAGGYTLDQPGFGYTNIGAYTDNRSYADNVDQYVIWDSSIRYLSSDELDQYSLQQICYAKNEIYARRGYIFQSQELRSYFSSKLWYQGRISDADFSSALLNLYEQANLELLRSREYSESPDGYLLY